MAYIKKLVINGFKSFANKIELPFDNGINVIMGPNGSGKSNISDALCFVLGRLGSKSLRAAKSSNLMFQGTHERRPSQEAFVEIVFDNSDKSFNIDSQQVHLKRIIRKKGLSTYKINGETKTRQEMLELLSYAGIDPNGYNIILQGEIARLIKMHPEERREIIEEVAGISIYELRKQKSLREIERTEQKLKEVSAVLRDRTSYLKNLEKERKQALRFKELEKIIKQCKGTILKRNLDEKAKETEQLEKEIDKNKKYKEKISDEIALINKEIADFDSKINEINKYIQKTTGFERESLNDEITELNAKIAVDTARKENFEKKLAENEIRKEKISLDISELEKEIQELKKKSPIISKRQDELKEKKAELEKKEQEKIRLYSIETEFNTIKERIRDKERQIHRANAESKLIFNQIKNLSEEVSSPDVENCTEIIKKISIQIEKSEQEFEKTTQRKFSIEKQISILESKIRTNEKLKINLPKSEDCPLCHSKLTREHINAVIMDANKKLKENEIKIKESKNDLLALTDSYDDLIKNIQAMKKTFSEKQFELIKLQNIEDKKQQMKKIMETEKELKKELESLNEKFKNLEKNIQKKSDIEEAYNKLFFEMQEISSRTDENLDTSILYKEKDIDGMKNIIKSILKDKTTIEKEISHLSEYLKSNSIELSRKSKDLQILSEKFKKLYSERTSLQEKIKQKNILLVNKQNALGRFEDVINDFKVKRAGVSASKESIEFELREFANINFIQGTINFLKEKLVKYEQEISTIGSVNLRALEVYDKMKEEYEKITEKVEQLEKEKGYILKIIEEIDNKKKKTFMKTFNAINDFFTRNFSQLSVKGKAFLDIANKEDIFAGGINILIKVAKGKYFDVTSLSGGEQTLVALSLIFAIQEYRPYCFYILDEIDAALDKRNSELLSNLLKKYMKSGQYIIISHNDSIISGANVLYGTSMNKGITKILSLKIEEG